MIQKDKVYTTRNFKPVHIVNVLPSGRYPVKGAILNPDESVSIYAWTSTGKFFWFWPEHSKDLVPATKHDFYKDGDENIPSVITDRNGQVCLELCKNCLAAERDLLVYNSCESYLNCEEETI